MYPRDRIPAGVDRDPSPATPAVHVVTLIDRHVACYPLNEELSCTAKELLRELLSDPYWDTASLECRLRMSHLGDPNGTSEPLKPSLVNA